MKTEARKRGDRGEDAAVAYLKKNHYRILVRNYTAGRREIDIIAEAPDALVFVEVKSRTYDKRTQERFGRPCMAVNAEKRRNLLAAAAAYISTHPAKKPLRFDVIEVYFTDDDLQNPPRIHHMPDAFRT